LILEESFGKPKDLKAAERLLLKEGLGLSAEKKSWEIPHLLKAVGKFTDPEAIEELLARIHLASKFGVPELPSLEGEKFADWVEAWFQGVTGLDELRKEDLHEKILSLLPFSTVQALNQLVPFHLTLSRGRRTKIHYRWGQEPWIQSRLQDFFGMKETPRILKGSLPLTLHLLAPNQRPVQVTKDLESFWKNTYPSLRKELGRKYPKHSWPEVPY
jgi:ATP-dependent helicase HrpB